MKPLISGFLRMFFGKELELRVKIFHILGIAGVVICISASILSLFQEMFLSLLITAGAGLFSLFLLIYSAKGGRQSFCYGATVVVIFLILFPSLFLFGGGYTGGMPFVFIFAVVYTVYMLEGYWQIGFALFELIYYSALCVFAYLYPEKIHTFATEADVLVDVIVGFLLISIALSATMSAQFRLYQRQQKELERARAAAEVANQAKSRFLANMSHEIRTPLHVIMSINELIRTEAAESTIRAYGEKIQDAGEVLRGLVDNILDMSKIEAGKTELYVAPYQTSDLIRVLELTGQTRCQTKKLKFRCICREIPPILCGDMAHIQQIAINLLSNAVKYTETGSVTLSVTCNPVENSGTVLLCIEVTDTGIGIDPEEIPILFEAFERASLPSHRHIEGTGLGLSIVKELCNRMGGSIRVKSRKGYGSTFTVELPQTVAAPESAETLRDDHAFVAPEGRVLVVDDNPENLAVMRELLHRTRLQVDTVGSGVAAMKAVREKPYHIILLDYMMPDMDGVETMRQLQKLHGFSTPVVALTANAVAGTRETLLKAGFSEYLSKPIPWGQLNALLLKYLPENLVTILPVSVPTARESAGFCEEYQPRLTPFRIDLSAALPFFDGDVREYLRTAEIFLAHGEDGQKTIAEFLQCDRDAGDLLYAVHALKSRAKNLGMLTLSEEAAHMEKLCRDNESEEVRSMIPHLLYFYRKAVEGLTILRPEMDALHPKEHPVSGERAVADCRRELPGLLDRLQRSPALECIDTLLAGNPTERERQMLDEMRKAVSVIQFEKASAICVDYLQMCGGVWVSDAES